MKCSLKEKEIDIENAIIEYLQRKRHLVLKHKRMGTYDAEKEIFRRDNNPLHKDSEGMADLQVIFDAEHYPFTKRAPHVFLEVKTKIGKQSKEQKEFEKRVTKYGCLYYVVRPINDVEKILGDLV